tara:strand:- start:680 stop:2155 length:1476 start_codon:yes stop_codon:yes gene_type:complete
MDEFELDFKTKSAAINSAYDMMQETPQTLGEFINETLENYMEQEPGEFVPLGEMHSEWEKTFGKGTHTAIICARGHLKTSWALSNLAYHMLTQRNFRALYISATLEQAWDKLEQFEELCRRSWRLQGMMKKKRGDEVGAWRKGAKYFNNGSRVHAASIGKALEGPHVHMIILDDVLQEFPSITDENVIHYIKRVVMPMRLPDERILLVGTQKRINDATDWVTESPQWNVVRHPALLDDETPRWPEYWTLPRLEEEKYTMGSRAFESEYMLNPLDPESAVIPYGVLNSCLDKGANMGLAPEGWETIMGVDLAVGMDTRNDETSYTVVAFNRETGMRHLLYNWTGKIQAQGNAWLDAQLLTLRQLSERFKPFKIIVESNGYQRLVVHAAQQLEGVPVEGHNTGREKHKVDIGIPGIAVRMEQGKYVIPWDKVSKENSKPGMRKLVDGLSRLVYGKNGRLEGHTPDAVMSLWMCELAIQEMERKRLHYTRWDFM